ncbi:MAG: FAD-binding protein [Pseudomonadota bacterium]
MEPLDLLIIGAGACGLVGAISAHDAGGSVAIVEANATPGGNSRLSTGSIPGAGSRFQRSAGIEDDPARMVADLSALAGPQDSGDLLELVARECAPLCEWLVDTLGVRLQLITDYRHVGHSVERLHAPPSRRGQDLVDDLLSCVTARAIPLATGQAAEHLLVREGKVCGARIAGEDVEARNVLLATNGFGANPGLVAEHCPEIARADYFGARGSTGDAVRWGIDLGAALGNMAAYQGYAAVVYPLGQILSWTLIEQGGILVGQDGRRFASEDLGYSALARHVLAQGPFAWAIFDSRLHQATLPEEDYAQISQMGAVRWSDTAEGLAHALGVDGEGLSATLARYGGPSERGDPFGRQDLGLAPLQAPYAGVTVKPGLFHTQGGLRVDTQARVLRHAGGVVPNLYAGGGAAMGISGRKGAAGYASGNGLITAMVLGRQAGLSAVQAAHSTAA